MYICKFCDYKTDIKKLYDKHANKKKHCLLKNMKINSWIDYLTDNEVKTIKHESIINGYYLDDGHYKCLFCGTIMDIKNNIKKHILNNCNVIQERYLQRKLNNYEKEDDKKEITNREILLTFEKEMKEIVDKKIEEYGKDIPNLNVLYEKIKTDIDNKFDNVVKMINEKEINQYNFIVNVIFKGLSNLPIIPLGKENIDFISQTCFRKILSNPTKSIGYLTEVLNFDIKNPSFWNIMKYNDGYIIYLNELKEWKVEKIEEIAPKIWVYRENQIHDLTKKYRYCSEMIDQYNRKVARITDIEYEKRTTNELISVINRGIENLELHINSHEKELQYLIKNS